MRLLISCGCLIGAGMMSAACNGPESSPPSSPSGFYFDGGGTPRTSGGSTPDFGASAVTQTNAPPAVSGGTLIITHDDVPVAADPDRDQVYIVSTSSSLRTIALQPGDEPGRLVEDGAGTIHVVLRRAGAVVSIDRTSASVIARRPVCPAPRGIAYDATGDMLYVACTDGQLMRLPPSGGAASLAAQLDPDLRDVVVTDQNIYVSRFRSAEVIVLDRSMNIVRRTGPAQYVSSQGRTTGLVFAPTVAWRMIADPYSGGVMLSHQRSLIDEPPPTSPALPVAGYYATALTAPCGNAIVHAAVTMIKPPSTNERQPDATPELGGLVLPVDIAYSRTSSEVAVIAAGNSRLSASLAPSLMVFSRGVPAEAGCGSSSYFVTTGGPQPTGEPIAVAYDSRGNLYVQSREPATLQEVTSYGMGMPTTLSTVSREDTGHEIFHSNSGGGIACASCHPEAGDDGHVWVFTGEGVRRSQDLRGGLLSRAPYHWAGEEPTLDRLMSDIFVTRMAGPTLTTTEVDALGHWLDHQEPIPHVSADAQAVARGQAIFQDATVACATCHNGALYTNDQRFDVGTGGTFKVPTLVGLASRAPYMHDGCAATLADRFGPCGGGDLHGHTSQLTPDQRSDLVAYLQSL